jgi:hypothetical protein
MAQSAKRPVSADRLSDYAKGKARAGKTKSTTAERKKQNVAVKDGAIKLGRGGRTYNVYDAKSGTWKRGVVKAAASTPKPKPKAKGDTGKGNYGGLKGFTPYNYRTQFGPGFEKQSGMRK